VKCDTERERGQVTVSNRALIEGVLGSAFVGHLSDKLFDDWTLADVEACARF
jgi:hypothetical protein